MDNEQAADWTDGGGVEVEGAVEVLPGRHVRVKGGPAEEVQGEFRLQEELVPEEVGEGIRDAGEHRKEGIFKSADGTFSNIEAMEICRDKLEISVPFINNGAAIIGASFIVKDLDINAVALVFEAQHDAVVGRNAMPVVA